jgi:cyclopropane-fatty-acyl-phospholipid synthase
VRDRLTALKIAADPMYQFGEAYAAGRVDVKGDLIEAQAAIGRALKQARGDGVLPQRLRKFVQRPRRNTLRGSRENIHHHYDMGNDFYKLWLDDQLVYTCAYYEDPSYSLEQAQRAKLNHVCLKLDLRPGESVVEAGCGWGALALHMARHYGVRVRAYNISKEQIAYARQQAKQSGLAEHVEFVQADWRSIRGQFDAFVSVGMLEHVGLDNYGQLGNVISGSLKPYGRGLIHSIGRNRPARFNPWIERRIFPGAYPPSICEMMRIFEPNDLSILDVENLRLHYARTCRHWLERFENAADAVRAMFDETFVRIWRFYLAGSAAAFESGWLQLFQIVFARGDNNQLPWNRRHVYHSAERSGDEPGVFGAEAAT